MKRSMKRLVSLAICLVMVLAVLPLGVFAAGTTTVYCQVPDNWTGCKAYWWGSSATNPGWPGEDMSLAEDGIWTYDVPSDATGLIFTNGTGAQTGDLTVPTDDKVMYVFANSYWTTYGKVEVVTEYFVAGSAALCGVEWSPNAAANKLSDDDNDGVFTITYTGVAVGEYEFKITNGSWAESWGLDGGEANYPLSVTEANSTVVISFDPATKTVNAVVNGTEPEPPVTEPIGTTFYVAGSFNGWNAAAEGYQMIANGEVTYELIFALNQGSYAMKVTNGTWDKSWGGEGAGGNYEFDVAGDNATVTVTFDTATETVSVSVQENTATTDTLIAEGTSAFTGWDDSYEGFVAEFVPAEDGTINVEISACDPGFYVDVYADGEWIEDHCDTTPKTISIDVTKGVTYELIISSISLEGDLMSWTAGSVSYKITADVAAGEAGSGDGPILPGTDAGSTEDNPLTIPAYHTTFLAPGETVWFLYDNYQHMVNDGVYSMMLQISSGASYTVSYRGVDVPVDENNFVNFEMFDMQMQGRYLFSVTNNGTADAFFSIEVKDRPVYINTGLSLVLGENVLILDTEYKNSLYEFTPDAEGIYTFTVSEGVIGNWGTSFNPSDNTENKGTTLEWTCTAVGQSILVGIADAENCVVTIEKTGDYVPEKLPDWVYYKNTYGFDKELPDDIEPTDIDCLDDKKDSFGVDKDGFCRYGTKYGPLMMIDLSEFPINLADAMLNGNGGVYLYDEDGKLTDRIDYTDALSEYLEIGVVPVTEELATMLRQLGDQHGWWLDGGFVFEEEAPEDSATAWMHFCSYLEGTELEPEDENQNTGNNGNTGNDGNTGNNGNQNGGQTEEIPKTADITVLGAVVTLVLSGTGLAGLKKKEDLFVD